MVRPLSSSGWHAMSGLVMKTGFIVQQIEGLHHMAEKAKKEAAKIVRMGFIGYGIQGRTVLVPHFIKQEQVVVKAVCDCDKTRREAAAEFVNNYYKENKKAKLAKCKAVADFRDIIADKDIQISLSSSSISA